MSGFVLALVPVLTIVSAASTGVLVFRRLVSGAGL
jgi:hypothetical protein